MTNFFENITTLPELKAAFKKLAAKFHPDRGGDTATMQTINNQYETLLKKIINGTADSEYTSTDSKRSFWESKQEHTEVEIAVKAAIDAIIHLEGLEIEIIGVWVWVSGDTRTHKDILKAAKFIWNHKQAKWVFMGKKSNGRGTMSMDEMREKHGSENVKSKSRTKIKAAA